MGRLIFLHFSVRLSWIILLSANCCLPQHRRSRRGQRGHAPNVLEDIVILCFERRFSKQNSIIHLKSSILARPKFFGPSQIFGLATPLCPNSERFVKALNGKLRKKLGTKRGTSRNLGGQAHPGPPYNRH